MYISGFVNADADANAKIGMTTQKTEKKMQNT